jgi:hypothetical protein
MANRFPLVLDTTDGNKIKELPADDNLNLRENSIVNVQDITALGTIDAGDIRVAGNRLVAQQFANLTDTPNSFSGANNYFVKVNDNATGIEFRPLSDLGTIEIDTINVDTAIVPTTDNTANIGTEDNKFNEIVANIIKGNLVSYNEEVVFNANTGKISYAALQGAPQFLSEFTNDVGYLRTIDLDNSIAELFDEGRPFSSDIIGSVFGEDSTTLVDATNSKIVGDIDFGNRTGYIQGDTVAIIPTSTVDLGLTRLLSNIVPELAEGGSVGTESTPFGQGYFTNFTADSITTDSFNYGTGVGVAELTAATNLSITAGNRVKIEGGVPFRISRADSTELSAIGAENGDLIYNTTTDRVIMYQNGEWLDVNGNVEAATGTSNFNNVVIAGNLTVSGTTTTVDTANTTITDNVIVLNNGETGAGVLAGTSGIEIDRGSEANKTLVWDETADKWTIGSETFVADTIDVSNVNVSNAIYFTTGGNINAAAGTILAIEADVAGGGQFNLIGGDNRFDINESGIGIYSGVGVGIESNVSIIGTLNAPSIIGDMVGSVFADDSSIMVDAVGNEIYASAVTAPLIIGTNINPVTGQNIIIGGSLGSFNYNDSTGAIQVASTGPVKIEGAATAAVNIGTGSSGTVTIGNGTNTIDITGGSTVDLTSVTVTGAVFNLTGNIDNTALKLGDTATSVTVGNASSTTSIKGNVSFDTALVVNNITADDSIIITTAVGNNNGITLQPLGPGNSVNIDAESVRFFGSPVIDNLIAQGGITGDLKGSVVGDDSAVILDGVANKVLADIENTNITTVNLVCQNLEAPGTLKAAAVRNDSTQSDLDLIADGFLILRGGEADSGTSQIQMDKNGINHIELQTIPGNPGDPTDYARIAVNADAGAGDVRIGTPISTRNQVVEIFNMTASGTLTGTVTGTVTGNLVGDVVGSVYADDSSLIIDGITGEIPGYISITQLQSIAAGAGTYADFQAAIAAL